MINLKQTRKLNIIKDILSNPRLFEVSNGHSDIPEFLDIDINSNYLLIEIDDKLAGCFQLKKFSPLIVEGHIHLLPEFWGKKCSINVTLEGIKWLKSNTRYTSILTDVPISCEHVHKLLLHTGFVPCGLIKDGCVFNNKFENLILYTCELNRDSNDK